jgi:hypothetical protein
MIASKLVCSSRARRKGIRSDDLAGVQISRALRYMHLVRVAEIMVGSLWLRAEMECPVQHRQRLMLEVALAER